MIDTTLALLLFAPLCAGGLFVWRKRGKGQRSANPSTGRHETPRASADNSMNICRHFIDDEKNRPAQAQLPDLSKAPKWREIAAKPEFQALPPEKQAEAKAAYFDYWIPLVRNVGR